MSVRMTILCEEARLINLINNFEIEFQKELH